MKVRLAGKQGSINFIMQDGEEIMAFVAMDEGQDLHIPNGIYDAEIVTESTTPISFLLN